MAKILHIEDDPANRLLVRKLLISAGFEVVEAADGLEGVRKAIEERPDLVLVDIAIPGLDGYEVTLRLRSEPQLRGMPDRITLEVLGLPSYLVVAAASPHTGPMLLADYRSHREAQELVRMNQAGLLVFRVSVSTLPQLLESATSTRTIHTAAVVANSPWANERPYWGALAEVLTQAPASGEVLICLDPVARTDDATGIETAMIDALLADGVSVKTVSRALTQLPGWSRRRAYDAVLRRNQES